MHPHLCTAAAETVQFTLHGSRCWLSGLLCLSVYFLFFITTIGAEAKYIKIGNDKQEEEAKGGIKAQLCARLVERQVFHPQYDQVNRKTESKNRSKS